MYLGATKLWNEVFDDSRGITPNKDFVSKLRNYLKNKHISNY